MDGFGVGTIDLSSKKKEYFDTKRIVPDLGQPRRRYEHERLEELTQSFRENGQKSFPLAERTSGVDYRRYILSLSDVEEEAKKKILSNIEDDEEYIFLVVGHRRWLAAQKAGFRELGVDLLGRNLSILERRIIQIDEDSHLPLTAWRNAEQLVRLLDYENAERKLEKKPEVPLKEFSVYAGTSERTAREALRYVRKLSSVVKKLVESDKLTYQKAVVISLLPGEEEQLAVAHNHGSKSIDDLRPIVYARLRKDVKAGSFFQATGVNYDGSKKDARDLMRETKNRIFKCVKLCAIDEEYGLAVKKVLREKAHRAIEAINNLEERVSKYTDYMRNISKVVGLNGDHICYDTIDKIIGMIEQENPPEPEAARRRRSDVKMIPLKWIRPDPNNPRGEIKEEEIGSLAESIKREGVLNPLLVERLGPEDYLLVFGERRYTACHRVPELGEVPCIVLTSLSKKLRLQLQKFENIQVPFSETERARALLEIYELSDATCVDELIAALKISRETGLAALRFAKSVAPKVKTLVEEGLLPYSSALLFANRNLQLPADEQLDVAYSAVLSGEVSQEKLRKNIEELLKSKRGEQKQKKLFVVPLDKERVYRHQAEQFALTIAGITQRLRSWDEYIIANVVSKDDYTIRYICATRKLLSDASRRAMEKAA